MSYYHIINFNEARLPGGELADLTIKLEDSSLDKNYTYEAETHGCRVLKFGKSDCSYDIDKAVVLPNVYTFALFDANDWFSDIYFNTDTVAKRGRVVLQIDYGSGWEYEIDGYLIETGIIKKSRSKVIELQAMPRTDILNKELLYDHTQDPPVANNPLGYGMNDFVLVTDLIKDIYKQINPSVVVTFDQDWKFKAKNLISPYDVIFDRNFDEVRISIYRFFFDSGAGFRTLSDVLKTIANDFGCYTGMLQEQAAFFRKFLFTGSGIDITNNIIDQEEAFWTNLIEYVVYYPLGLKDEKKYAGTFSNVEGRFIERDCQLYTTTSGSGSTIEINYNSDIYGVIEAKDSISGLNTYRNNVQLLADYWYYVYGYPARARVRKATVKGIGYQIDKTFTIAGVRYQAVSLMKDYDNNKCSLELMRSI